ncbi:HNH endonuclease [Microcoleus sp. FACHB-1515]|uniref:HNH endonuclease n=1 Tax=Cyanophyceae TaxID=3028117 RepID=UPI0016883C19|nr:HNH endonuclease [Microcoleus sp. FACHB-1515]MBD2092869.1 HNH endonuclease [Microcoleus sp. FACHB-1515]
MKARNFIKPGEKVIVIFTRGIDLEINSDNTGSTGNWDLNPNHSIDRVIIYRRDDEDNTNSLYIATHAGVEATEWEGRYKIYLNHIQYVGVTDENWKEFAECGANPIRYFP